MEPMKNSKHLLDCACYWERNTPDRLYFTQPMGGGDDNIKTWTWKAAVDEARRMVPGEKTDHLASLKDKMIELISSGCNKLKIVLISVRGECYGWDNF